jgi:translation elongation factor EF-4
MIYMHICGGGKSTLADDLIAVSNRLARTLGKVEVFDDSDASRQLLVDAIFDPVLIKYSPHLELEEDNDN